MDLNITILAIYSLHLIFFLIFLIQQGIAFKKINGYLCEVSGLGELKMKYHKIYNFGYFMFGLLSLVFTFNLSKILIPSVFTSIGIFFTYLADISLCFISIYPRDTHAMKHLFYSLMLFIGTISSLLFLIIPFLKTDIIPDSIVLLNIFIIIFASYYSYIKIKNYKRYGKDNGLEKEVSTLEWISFLSTILWSFILTIVLIFNSL